jgi:deoxyribodipyrimidine photo-lyase
MTTNKDETAIFWFRRDLRIEDNAALYHALKSDLKVLPIFIFDKDILEKIADKYDARVNFIHQQLEVLNLEFQKYQSGILTYYATPLHAFKEIDASFCIKAVYTNNDYEPYAIKRDQDVSDFLAEKGIQFFSYKDQLIFEKNEILKPDGKPYTVFTPYMKRWKLKLNTNSCLAYPSEEYAHNLYKIDFKVPLSMEEIGFKQSHIAFPEKYTEDQIIKNYEATRNFPILPTSKMGIHLRFGTLSIRSQVKIALKLSDTWLNELIWREFFHMIIYHFPYSAQQSFKPAYDRIEWRNNEKEFECWCRGETGFPIIDAGMRELNQTGFMHNRVRMLVASFLCKNLLIDWRWGEAYFAEKLLDYDLAANVGNWQWAAGSGCDAAPYFRIFNPLLQAEKFDKNQEYIKKWVAEIGTQQYPHPIVDAKSSAKHTIEVYKKALQSSS